MPDDQLEAKGEILEVLEHGGYRARLANGHICVARMVKNGAAGLTINAGDSVWLAFHPADLSRARISGMA